MCYRLVWRGSCMHGGQGFGSTRVQEKPPLFHVSLPGFPLCLFLASQVFLCALVSPQNKAQVCLVLNSNGKQLNFIWFFTQCYKSPLVDLLHGAGLWRAGKTFGRAGRNIKFRFLILPQKKKKNFHLISQCCLYMETGAFLVLATCLVSEPRCPKWRFPLFYYWKSHWCLNMSS